MRVLATAYACDPRVGSEPGIGWNWICEIAQRHECWLVTRENNVELVREAAREAGLERLHVVGFDLPAWARWWKRGSRGAVAYFYLWQLALAPLARRLDRQHDFDVVHHLTFASSWIPSGLAWVRKPFVWGPVGMHPRIPDRFVRRSDWRTRCAEWMKWAVRGTLSNLDPFVRYTLRSADQILSLGSTGSSHLRRAPARVVPMLACGAPELEAPEGARRGAGAPFEILYAGRLVDLKGVRLALDAFVQVAETVPQARLHLAGDGPLLQDLERAARDRGVYGRVTFHGHLEHRATLDLMGRSHVFLFPSFEGAGMVVIEAFAHGLPVVCLATGGPGEMVNEERGIRAPVLSFDATASALACALLSLHDDEPLRRRLSAAARTWARQHGTWRHKGERLAGIYAAATAARRASA